MGVMSLRQNAAVATNILELAQGHLDPQVRRAIDAQFAAQILHDPLPAEYVQGLFSGMYLAQNWLRTTNQDNEALGLVTNLTIELARKYIEQLETEVTMKAIMRPK